MQPKDLFFDRHGELRSGYRMLLFAGLSGGLFLLLASPLAFLRLATDSSLRLAGILAVVGASYVMTRFINNKPFTAIGLSVHPAAFREFGIGCLSGFLMMTGVFVVEYVLGYVNLEWRALSASGYAWVLLSACGYFFVGAVFEELVFRGYVFQTLMQAITFLPAMSCVAVLFAVAHSRNPHVNAFGLVNIALAAVWLSFAYLKTRSLWLPIGLHFSWNLVQTTLFSFPTSGMSVQGRSMTMLSQGGPEWLVGGAFGPEGGALATIALIAGTWYTLKSKILTAPEGIVTLDSSEDLLIAGVRGGADSHSEAP